MVRFRLSRELDYRKFGGELFPKGSLGTIHAACGLTTKVTLDNDGSRKREIMTDAIKPGAIMKIVKVEIKPLSQCDQCILIIHTDVDYLGNPSKEGRPEVQQQFPTAVAAEIKQAVEYHHRMIKATQEALAADATFQALPRL